MLIPFGLALLLGRVMFGLRLPTADRGFVLPVANCDAETVRTTCRLDAEIARHAGRDLDHALRSGAIAVVAGIALRREDHGIVRWRRAGCEAWAAGLHLPCSPIRNRSGSFL